MFYNMNVVLYLSVNQLSLMIFQVSLHVHCMHEYSGIALAIICLSSIDHDIK